MSEAEAPGTLSPLKRAFLAIEDLEARLAAAERGRSEPIAVVGMGCRLPGGASSPGRYWDLLAAGVDAVTDVPSDRFDVDAVYDPDPDAPGRMSTRWGAFVDGLDRFDAQLFGIAPREAATLDPQQRLLLEVAWEALEDGGLAPDRLAGSRTGVYIGIVNSDYRDLQTAAAGVEGIDTYFGSGTAHSIASGRLSYVFGFRGPSLSIDTACSASLVAVHLACRSLRAGETDMALAGGVNAILTPEPGIALSKLRMMAPDGRCKAFDARADGFVRGEGCGIVVLKRLGDALAAGDAIRAVIRGSAVNQDGPASGLTVPNGPAQEGVVREALVDAGVAPADVTFVETHGTGTSLGDPIEVQALASALREGRDPGRPVLLGSVKTNIGHLESAAGIAGLLKAILVLERREIPPHLHLERPNPHIPWDALPVAVPTARTAWPDGAPLVAGVSSFGFSGTNAHIVLEAAPEFARETGGPERPLHLLALSGGDRAARAAQAAQIGELLGTREHADLADVAFSANTGRAHLASRVAVIAPSASEAAERLERWRAGEEPSGVVAGDLEAGDPPRIGFLFTGQGSQYAGMGKTLYETQPTFRGVIDRCDAVLRDVFGRPLLPVLHPPDGTDSPIAETGWSQPALFALEIALAELLRSFGVRPAVVLGHSIGEYAAACLAGVFDIEDGMRLVAERGRLMQSLPPGGAMAAVLASEARVAEELSGREDVCLACVNAPDSVVVSGVGTALDSLLADLARDGVRSKRLDVSHAFHSPLVEPVLDAFEAAASSVRLTAPTARIVSSVTGEPARGGALADPAYWRGQLREPVRFADALASVHALGCDVLVELGPAPVLLGLAERTLPADVVRVPTLRPGADDWRQLLEAVARLYAHGASIDWAGFDGDYRRRRLRLPTYPFQRRRHWIGAGPARPARPAASSGHPLLGRRLRSPLREVQFEAELAPDQLSFLSDHVVGDTSILPAAAYAELADAAARELLPGVAHAVEDITIVQPLAVEPGASRTVQLVARPAGEGSTIEIASIGADEDEWCRHATARIVAAPAGAAAGSAPAELAAELPDRVSAQEHYQALEGLGLAFGPSLRGVVEVWRRDGEALARVRLPDAYGHEAARYGVHPALLDACLQALVHAVPAGGELQLPVAIDRFCLFESPGVDVWSHVRLAASDGTGTRADLRLLDDEGRVVAELVGLRAVPVPAARGPFHEVVWRLLPVRGSDGAPPLPFPSELAALLEPGATDLAAAHGLDDHGRLVRKLDDVAVHVILAALRELGWAPVPGEAVAAEALGERLGVVARHRRLLGRLLEILGEAGVLAATGGEWRVAREAEPGDVDTALASLAAEHPRARAQIDIVARCASGLAEALAGRADPLQLLFPGGSLEPALELYSASSEAAVFNGLVARAVGALASARPGHPLRVLEVGAGTGGTTAAVLPVLPDGTEYVFTDVSPVFLAAARERFAAFPFVRYADVDLEGDLEAQGLPPGGFDLVLAANVLHAVADLPATLERLRRMLAPGGLLLALEATAPERWIDLTFGLTDGWWRFDDRLRTTYPLLARERWLEALAGAGFEGPAAVSPVLADSTEAILAARAPLGAEAAGAFVILGDAGGTGERLAAALEERGRGSVLVPPGADPVELLAQALAGERVAGVVHLSSLDVPVPAEGEDPVELARRGCDSGLRTVQALAGTPVRLWLVTRGAQPVAGPGCEPLAVQQSPLWGLGKVVALEHPELHCVRVDLDPEDGDPARTLAAELAVADGEEEVGYRRGLRYGARLLRVGTPAAPAAPTSSRLVAGGTGVLDDLTLVAAERGAPAAGEVEIEVAAAGLNFRDVLNALAMRDDPEPLGSECAGRITAVGEGVEAFAVGDEVVAIGAGCFASHVIANVRLVRSKPERLTFAEAAALPMATITASFALRRVGELQAGERVLVHSGAGGVGLAAVRLALAAGAEVYATAGSDEKRAFLEATGVHRALSSRSLRFADELREATGGRGVDVVLNSLAGEFIPASLGMLAAGGRFLELGKRDVWSPERVAEEFPGVRYTIVDLSTHFHDGSPLLPSLFDELARSIDDGLEPLPVTAFPLEDAPGAFRFMAQARHTGKIVVTRDGATGPVRRDATYLVTGGLAGLGLAAAERLAERGARRVVLMGRSAPAEAARASIEALGQRGVDVVVVQGDVSRREDVRRAVDAAHVPGAPLRGIVHSAGVLDDGVLANQDWARFQRVLAPKVGGGWYLHEAAAGLELDWLVFFASAAGVLGSSGQGNHAAANAFLDTLAHHRRALGLPAVSIDWGAWAELGAAAERAVVERVAGQGIGAIAPAEGLDAFERCLSVGCPQVLVAPIDWRRYLERLDRVPALLAELVAEAASVRKPEADASRNGGLLAELEGAPPARRRELLLAYVGGQAARALGLDDGEDVPERRPLQELGFDSLMAVEFRNLLGAGLGLDRPLPATLVFDYPTVSAIVGYVEREVLALPGQEAPAGGGGAEDLLEAIGQLSDDEVDRLLAEREGDRTSG